MILIFNFYAVLPVAFGILVGCLLSQSSSLAVSILAGGGVAAGIDLLQRFVHREESAALVNPQAGGHLFYMPVWMWGIIGSVLVVFGGTGIADRPAPPPPQQVQLPPPPPQPVIPPNLRQPQQQPVIPPNGGQPQQHPVIPPNARNKQAQPQQPGVVPPPGNGQAVAAPRNGRRGPRPGPGMAPVAATRPPFATAPVKKVALADGRLQADDQFGLGDAADRTA